MSRAMELRILTGVHAGAREALNGEAQVIGADAACDFVLADEGVLPRHARVTVHQDGWQLQWLADESTPPLELKPGLALSLGPVLVTVDEPHAPWPATPQVHELQAVPAANDESAPAEGERIPAAATAAPQPAVAAAQPLVAVSRGAWWLAGALVLAGAGAVVALRSIEPPPPPMPPVAPRPSLAQRIAIERVLHQLDLEKRARVEPSGANWVVRATYLTEAEGDQLAEQLSKVQPRPGLRMTSEQDLRQDVDEAILRLGPGIHGVVKSKYLGDARFRLEGTLADAGERAGVLQALRTSFPQVRGWDNGVLVPQDVAAQLLDELRSGGFEDVAGHWEEGTFAMDVKLSQAQVPRWERTLQAALDRHPVPMRATLSFNLQQTAALARLPFQVRSVMGGDPPYVVLDDGSRMLLDGTHAGWRLSAIRSTDMIFEKGGQRAVLPR